MSAARFGVYVHFPYCLSKCPYCDFSSTSVRQIPEDRYARAVARELQLRAGAAPALRGRRAESVYLGGGTPSLWDPSFVGAVLEAVERAIGFAEGLEITLEANPGASDAARFGGYRSAGVNRLSIGVQSFQEGTLAALGRVHDAVQAEAAYRAARAAGFDNVSLDFIYGVHGQTLADVEADAKKAAGLGPEHVSAYALTLDRESLAEEVPLAKQLARAEVELPGEEEIVEMGRALRAAYAAAHLARYEISNYAKPGYHSRHNALYWTGGEYLALGAGATGFLRDEGGEGGERYSNPRSADRYLWAVEEGKVPSASRERLGRKELFEERLAMGLRLASGVGVAAVCELFGEPWEPRMKKIEKWVARGLARWDGKRLALTDAGADLHSALCAEIL
jgi:oxygen-independent coproporphyrinogen-3 oxidase